MDPEQRRLLDLLLPDSDPRKAYCGIDGLWVLPASHPFNLACQLHDQMYRLAKASPSPPPTSDEVDDLFLKNMLQIAGNDPLLIAEAYFFEFLCSVWSRFRWPGQQMAEERLAVLHSIPERVLV